MIAPIKSLLNKYKAGFAYGKARAESLLHVETLFNNESAQAAPMAMLGLVMAAAIMLGIISIVLTLMPSIAGDIMSAIDVSASNPFYNLTQDAPAKAASSFNLLWVAVLVAVVVIIIAGVAGLAFMFMRPSQ
jgi:hypothetical protein